MMQSPDYPNKLTKLRGTQKYVSLACAVALLALVLAVAGGGCMSRKAEPKAADDATAAQTTSPNAGTKGDAAPEQYRNQFEVSTGDPEKDLDLSERALELAIRGQLDEQGTPLADEDRCTIVCKALTSMRNAAAELCKLDESRCQGAQSRLTRAETRARDACPACASPI